MPQNRQCFKCIGAVGNHQLQNDLDTFIKIRLPAFFKKRIELSLPSIVFHIIIGIHDVDEPSQIISQTI